jgi:hypothetical protein
MLRKTHPRTNQLPDLPPQVIGISRKPGAIPWTSEQRNNSAEHGNNSTDQGIKSAARELPICQAAAPAAKH